MNAYSLCGSEEAAKMRQEGGKATKDVCPSQFGHLKLFTNPSFFAQENGSLWKSRENTGETRPDDRTSLERMF